MQPATSVRHEETDVRFYWGLLRRWWWVLILGALVGAATGFFASGAVTPMYVASAKIFVQPGRSFQPSVGDIQATRQLAQAYTDLIKTKPLLDEVNKALSLPYSAEELAATLSVSVPASLIVISVTNPDPALAAQIATKTARVFIDQFRRQQITELALLQSSLADLGISQDPQIIAAQATTASALTVWEEAAAPLVPTSPNTRLNVLLAALLGIAFAGGIVYLLERLDDTVKSPDDMRDLTGLTTLGSVFRWPVEKTTIPTTLADESQRSSLAESFKFLSTNLEFAAAGTDGFKTLMVTSASPSEGKTTAATNLAITMARQGKSVILVDCDLRKPQIHRTFGVDSNPGLTNLFLGNEPFDRVVRATQIPGLRVVTSGPIPPDPTQILRLPRVRESVEALRNSCDVMIFDAPPVLAVADALVLAGIVDGAILVVDTQRTSRNFVFQAAESLRQTRTILLGAVLNKIAPSGRGRYYYYYRYYRYYPYYYYSAYGDGASEGREGGRRGLGARLMGMFMLGSAEGATQRRRSSRRRRSHSTSGTEVKEPSAPHNGENGQTPPQGG